MRKTKIVCTLGPATDSEENIEQLIQAGMNVARLNMSHGTQEEHREKIERVKLVREKLNLPVAIMTDTKGPEIRIKTFENGKVFLNDGDEFTLTTDDIVGTERAVTVTFRGLPQFLRQNDSILINDGLIELRAKRITKKTVVCEVVHGGVLSDRKSINLPGIKIDMPYLSEADKSDIAFSCQMDVDYLALSFVRSADDVKVARNFVNANGGKNIQLIAKLENREGVDNAEEILKLADGIMVARGDMGVEIPFEELPNIQKKLIKMCYEMGKKVITATQMLESMITNPRPTRAEISDVANAVYDGSSAIMLSGETAAGKYPFEAVKTMAKIAEEAEDGVDFNAKFHNLAVNIKSVTDAVSHSAVSASFDLKAKAIITVTTSGYTSRQVSRFRPSCPIIGATTDRKVYNQLALNWGVVPVMGEIQTSSEALFNHSISLAKETGIVKKGDLAVVIGSSKVGASGNSDTLRIEKLQ